MPRLHFRTKPVLPRIKPSKNTTNHLYRLLQKSSKRSKGRRHDHGRERFSILNSVMQLVQGLLAQNEREQGLKHRQKLLKQHDLTVQPDIKVEIKQEPTGSGLRRLHLRKRHR